MHIRVDIRKNDTVKVIAGRGKNAKEGKRVLAVFPNDGKLLVEGVKLVKKHVKAQQGARGTQGGIADQESRIAISNVMLVCPACKKPTRVNHDRKGNTVVRVCNRCETQIDK
jgi:large subunit ribosomal protein L24